MAAKESLTRRRCTTLSQVEYSAIFPAMYKKQVSRMARPFQSTYADLATAIAEQTPSDDDPSKPGQPDIMEEFGSPGDKRLQNDLPIMIHTVITTSEPYRTVATCAQELEHGQHHKRNYCDAVDRTLHGLLTKHQIRLIQQNWRGRHRQQVTNLVFSPPSRTPRMKSSMHTPWKCV